MSLTDDEPVTLNELFARMSEEELAPLRFRYAWYSRHKCVNCGVFMLLGVPLDVMPPGGQRCQRCDPARRRDAS